MRRPPHRCLHSLSSQRLRYSTQASQQPVIAIGNATFYRNFPAPNGQDAAQNPPIFPNLQFDISASAPNNIHWAVIGPSNSGKTTFFEILRGQHVSLPPSARSYPRLASGSIEPYLRNVSHAIRYVGFDEEKASSRFTRMRGTYLGARYESRKEDTDFSVRDILQGNTNLNPLVGQEATSNDESSFTQVVDDLDLQKLLHMPVRSLSNGQLRRASIARALLRKPLLLLLDEPFMGLDPPTTAALSPLLHGLSAKAAPCLVLALRPQDPIPDWITHTVCLEPDMKIAYQGSKSLRPEGFLSVPRPPTFTKYLRKTSLLYPGQLIPLPPLFEKSANKQPLERMRSREGLRIGLRSRGHVADDHAECLVEMQNISINYGEGPLLGGRKILTTNAAKVNQATEKAKSDLEEEKTVKDDQKIIGRRRKHIRPKFGLSWEIKRGERWGLFGPNGSGKTTLISLISSDHPLSYALPVKIFGKARLPQLGQAGTSVFEIQRRIGHSSPEIHASFPAKLSIRQVIENAWADTFLGTPQLSYENDLAVDACLRWFEAELNPAFDPALFASRAPVEPTQRLRDTGWADEVRFGESPFSSQRVALFLRAIVKHPDLVILDEAFSGMDDDTRDKCMLFLTWGDTHFFAIRDGQPRSGRFVIENSSAAFEGLNFGGLRDDQALICISHVKEEVPGILSKWLCLPPADTSRKARFGRFAQPLDAAPKQWNAIWRL